MSEYWIALMQRDLRPHQIRTIIGVMPDFFLLQLLLATFAGWVNREQARVVAYLIEENRVLKEQLRGRRNSAHR